MFRKFIDGTIEVNVINQNSGNFVDGGAGYGLELDGSDGVTATALGCLYPGLIWKGKPTFVFKVKIPNKREYSIFANLDGVSYVEQLLKDNLKIKIRSIDLKEVSLASLIKDKLNMKKWNHALSKSCTIDKLALKYGKIKLSIRGLFNMGNRDNFDLSFDKNGTPLQGDIIGKASTIIKYGNTKSGSLYVIDMRGLFSADVSYISDKKDYLHNYFARRFFEMPHIVIRDDEHMQEETLPCFFK